MLLVDHDQAEMGCGSKNGTPRTDDHLDVARGNLLPMPMPFGRCQVTVQHRHAVETRLKTGTRLRGQADLRYQDNRLTTVLNHLVDRPNIDFRLPAARHPMDHNRLVTAVTQWSEDSLESALLVVIERQMIFALHRLLLANALMHATHFFHNQLLAP